MSVNGEIGKLATRRVPSTRECGFESNLSHLLRLMQLLYVKSEDGGDETVDAH